MISAVIAYADRMPLEGKCRYYKLADPFGPPILYGHHFRKLLHLSVRSLLKAGVKEVVVVNYNNHFYSTISVPGAKVINYSDGGGFSEWDAKYLGIQKVANPLIITSNADIYHNKRLVLKCKKFLLRNKKYIFQGTKCWLSKRQTLKLIRRGILEYYRGEVKSVYGWPVCGVEPLSWGPFFKNARHQQKYYGIDTWKNSGDFQAFHKDALKKIQYPLGTSGWGHGDIEFRIRAKYAGYRECWNREFFVLHMFHPVLYGKIRFKQLDINRMILVRQRLGLLNRKRKH